VAPGEYRVLVRHGGVVSRCELQTAGGAAVVDLDRCTSEPIAIAAAKGGDEPGRRLRFEVDGIVGTERQDGFTNTLKAFGYQRSGGLSGGLAFSALWRVERRLWLGGMGALVSTPDWTLPTERRPLRFSWSTATLGPLVRAIQPLGDHGRAARAGVYAQLGAGIAFGTTRLIDQDDQTSYERFTEWAATMGAGLRFDGPRTGVALGYQFDHASGIHNLIGDTHASGGHRLVVGASYAY